LAKPPIKEFGDQLSKNTKRKNHKPIRQRKLRLKKGKNKKKEKRMISMMNLPIKGKGISRRKLG